MLALAITLGLCVLASLSISGVATVAALRRSDRLVETAAELASLGAKLFVLTAALDAASRTVADERARADSLEAELAALPVAADPAGARLRVITRVRAAAGAPAGATPSLPQPAAPIVPSVGNPHRIGPAE